MASGPQENHALGQLELYLENLKSKFDKLEALTAPIPAIKIRAASVEIQKAEEALKDLEALACKRLSSIKDAAKKATDRKAFSQLFGPLEEQFFTQYDRFQKINPEANASETARTAEVAVVQANVDNVALEIEEHLAHLNLEVDGEDAANKLSSARYKYFLDSLQEVSGKLDTALPRLYNRLYELEPAKITTHSAALKETAKKHAATRRTVSAAISKFSVEEPDPISSTRNNTMVGLNSQLNDSRTADDNTLVPGTFQSKLHAYKPDSYPSFKDGEYLDYPAFKQEFKTGVQPGRPVAWVIKKLNELTPKHVDLSAKETVDEAWEELDARYGNPIAVADHLLTNFINNTTLSGNDDQKIVQLEGILTKLLVNLRSVDAEDQLTSNISVLSKVFKMIPFSFLKDLTDLRQQHVDVPGQNKALAQWNIVYPFIKAAKKSIFSY